METWVAPASGIIPTEIASAACSELLRAAEVIRAASASRRESKSVIAITSIPMQNRMIKLHSVPLYVVNHEDGAFAAHHRLSTVPLDWQLSTALINAV